MKYWESIADNLSKGWSSGCVAVVDSNGRTIWIADAHRSDGKRFEWATATLEKGRVEQVGIQTSAAMELLSEHCQRKADHARALWALLVLGEWLDWVATETDCGQTDQGHKGVFAEPPDKLTGKVPFRPVCSRLPAASADQSFRRK